MSKYVKIPSLECLYCPCNTKVTSNIDVRALFVFVYECVRGEEAFSFRTLSHCCCEKKVGSGKTLSAISEK